MIRTSTRQNNRSNNVLGNEINGALKELIRLSKKLIEFADQETQALITQDHMSFAITQQDKECLAKRYAKASEEFRTRLDDFRHADKGILMQLDKLQSALKDKTQENNILIDRIKTRASANTKATLFTVQELGQRVHLPTNNMDDENNNMQHGKV